MINLYEDVTVKPTILYNECILIKRIVNSECDVEAKKLSLKNSVMLAFTSILVTGCYLSRQSWTNEVQQRLKSTYQIRICFLPYWYLILSAQKKDQVT
jgi:hypothetical protein